MKELYKALSAFQQECPIIHKGTEGYGYSYAGLPEIMTVINPLLAKNGLVFTQLLVDHKLETILFHIESGEHLKSSAEIPQGVQLAKMNQFQVDGSAITYYRRYALSAILGIVTDKDTDCGQKQQNNNTVPKNKPQPQSNGCISDGQGKRLYAIYKKANINNEAMQAWLFAQYGYSSSKDIKISDYDNIIKAIESGVVK